MIEMCPLVPKGFVNEHPLFHGTKFAHAIIKDGFSLAHCSKFKKMKKKIFF